MSKKTKIETSIDVIQNYIDGCKAQLLNSNKIVVDKDTMEEMLNELRASTPEEIKRYQKMLSQKDNILADAQQRAEQIIAQAQIQTTELVSEHQIMQQAYAQANEVVLIATKQAQDILDNATNEANSIRMGAMTYTDDQLRGLEELLTTAVETTKTRNDNLITSLQGYLDVITNNRSQLFPPEEAEEEQKEDTQTDNSKVETVDLSNVSIQTESADE